MDFPMNKEGLLITPRPANMDLEYCGNKWRDTWPCKKMERGTMKCLSTQVCSDRVGSQGVRYV